MENRYITFLSNMTNLITSLFANTRSRLTNSASYFVPRSLLFLQGAEQLLKVHSSAIWKRKTIQKTLGPSLSVDLICWRTHVTSRNQGTFCKEKGRGLWERGCVGLRMLTYFRLSGPKKHNNSFQYIFWTNSNYIWISWSPLNFMIPRVIVWQIQRLIFGRCFD